MHVPPPESNALLAALPPAVSERVKPLLAPMRVSAGLRLHESRKPLDEIYFPADCLVTLVYVTREGGTAELALAGKDALIGVSGFLDDRGTPSNAMVLTAGLVYRASTEQLKKEFELGGAFQRTVRRYTQALFVQVAQTAVCNRHHSVDQQLCRWLLLCLDRLASSEVRMTQELIANMLGVRREGITLACGRLRDQGVVRCTRGIITVLDREALEAAVCECYAVIRDEYAALVHLRPPGLAVDCPR